MKKNSPQTVRNPFYEDIQRNGIIVEVQSVDASESIADACPPGRPKRGEIRQPTAVRSVRLPIDLWKLVQAQARRERISLNAALRQAARIWLRS